MKVLILLAAVACASAYYMPYNYHGNYWGNWAGAYRYATPYAYNGYHGYSAPYAYNGYHGYAAPYAYNGYHGYAAPYAAASQYHAQDAFGGASYGHSEPLQHHVSNSDAYGRRAGSYSYVSPEGKVLRFDYTADERGFRVASNALPVAPKADLKAPVDTGVAPMPVDFTPEVKEATAAHMKALAEASQSRKKRAITYPYAFPYTHGLTYTPYTYDWNVPVYNRFAYGYYH